MKKLAKKCIDNRLLLFALIIAINIISLNSITFAQHLTPRPPLFGIPAKTLPQNHWVFRSYWIYNDYNSTWSSTDNSMTNVPDGLNFNTNFLWGKIRYGITNNLLAIVNVPYVHKSLKNNGVSKSGSGLGDIIGALLYKFHNDKPNRFLVSGLLFTKSPTGKSSGLGKNELATGTGSFDYGAALLPEKEFGKWDMRLSSFYLFRGDNDENVNLGDLLSFSWSTAYNFSKNLIAEGTLYYKRTFNNSRNGEAINNSDTYLLQFIPGVQYRIYNSFLIQFVMPLTITQKRPFGSDYETWVGLYYMI